MTENLISQPIEVDRESIPTVVFVAALLLSLDGSLVLLGCLYYPAGIVERLIYGSWALVILTTGILILRNHRAAPYLALVSAILLTVEELRQFPIIQSLMHQPPAVGRVARTVFNVFLYWVCYFAYKRWASSRGMDHIR